MSVRLRYRIETSVSSSPADLKDLGNVCLEVTSDAPSEGGIWKTRVLKNTNPVLPLDSISEATFLFLRIIPADPTETLAPINVTLNGTATLTLLPVGTSNTAHFLISSAGLTSLQIANNDNLAVDADVTIGTCGD
jgi:hypothetical protein